MKEMHTLSSKFFCSWDPLHKIGVRQDDAFKWLVDLTTVCQQLYSKFNWGKNYQALVEMCEKLEIRIRNLKIFRQQDFLIVLDQYLTQL